ncbi:MAG: hypothetical protein FWG14_13860 [Peptococcaceae bacterium]|nr:hypothetical protein [Peptococcaceae bacterium]
MYTLTEIENEYRKRVNESLKNSELTALLLVELSARLFQELKVKNIADPEDDGDMLLYQYGIYQDGEHGKYFSFDITRQFITLTEEEPYQLCFTLIYDTDQFEGIDSYDSWSIDFDNLESFINDIKRTDGFELAGKSEPKTYRIEFDQC